MKKKIIEERPLIKESCVCGHTNNYHYDGKNGCARVRDGERCDCCIFVKWVPSNNNTDEGWILDVSKFMFWFVLILLGVVFFGYFSLAFISWLGTDPLNIII